MNKLQEYLPNKKIQYFDEISSTNTVLKMHAAEESENTIFVSDFQTAGRGRLGKTFFSPKGCGVYLSYLIKPELAPKDAVFITVAAAVAVRRTLLETLNIDTKIKWVNDIYFEDKKLCGILTEAGISADGKLSFAILGVGINIKNPPGGYPEDFAYKTTNIEKITGEITNDKKRQLMAAFINNFDIIFNDKSRSYIKEYKEASCILGREIEILSGEHKGCGQALDIDSNANLIVKKQDGNTVALGSGDVSIRF